MYMLTTAPECDVYMLTNAHECDVYMLINAHECDVHKLISAPNYDVYMVTLLLNIKVTKTQTAHETRDLTSSQHSIFVYASYT